MALQRQIPRNEDTGVALPATEKSFTVRQSRPPGFGRILNQSTRVGKKVKRENFQWTPERESKVLYG